MTERPLRRARIVTPHPVDLGALTSEFPSVAFEQRGDDVSTGAPVVDVDVWLAATDFREFDARFLRASSDAIVVRSGAEARLAPRVAWEALTRLQRRLDRRNHASIGAVFDAVLRAHRALHDTSKPLVAADLDHALDTWQWVLRLSSGASLPLQLAALFHDVERLESEADRRVEHRAADYQAFKDAHARRGAALAFDVLVAAGVAPGSADRARALVAAHERPGADPELDLLNDADALSFFSLNSPGYADYFGPAQTRRKVAYTLGRMSHAARARLATVRLRPDVRRLLDAEAA